jgi:hypothetical protein
MHWENKAVVNMRYKLCRLTAPVMPTQLAKPYSVGQVFFKNPPRPYAANSWLQYQDTLKSNLGKT